MEVVKIVFLFGFVCVNAHMEWRLPKSTALDQSLYEDALDPELCDEQIGLIMSDTILAMQCHCGDPWGGHMIGSGLLVADDDIFRATYEEAQFPMPAHMLIRGKFREFVRFVDSGIRTPRGVLEGNMVDLGNYHQCLDILRTIGTSDIQGKFCMIRLPLNNFQIPQLLESPTAHGLNKFKLTNETLNNLKKFNALAIGARAMTGDIDDRLLPDSPFSRMIFNLAVCIPKPCSTEQALTSALFNFTAIGLNYTDDFCRLPNDKPWSGADYAMTVVLAAFGLLTLISTSYDLYYTVIRRNVSSKVNPMGKIFSVYTNGRRLMTFSSGSDSIDCIDGIRAIAMLWVLVGHAFTSVPVWTNPFTTFQWIPTLNALWITSAHVTVDTFFTLSGLLVVYTTAGKLNGRQLMKNLHLFYLNRLLRMFPILGWAVLYEASFHNHITDGPLWNTVARHVETCRVFWWSTLLHVQNYASPETTCVGQSWYLAIDVQLHILSPSILFFVLSGKKTLAWIALAFGNIAIIVASTIFNFHMEFPSSMLSPGRAHQMTDYLVYYYVNTLTRAAPFLIGMIIGYIMHLYRDSRMKLSKRVVVCIWITFLGLQSFVVYASYVILQSGWDNQMLDSLFNSFIRPIWAIALGLMIIACQHGYGGPLNWLFTWHIWKLPARLSYAMYLVHYALMFNVNYALIAPTYFSIPSVLFTFLGHFMLTFLVSYLVTLVIDAPFSTLLKMLLGNPKKKDSASDDGTSDITKANGKQM